MRIKLISLSLIFLVLAGLWENLANGQSNLDEGGWRVVRPGDSFEFPRDHGPHADYKVEWWYLTGNLRSPQGREFGFQITFFRRGFRPPSVRDQAQSRFIVQDGKLADFTLTDIANGKFYSAEKTARGAYGEAGFLSGSKLVWIGDWEMDLDQQWHVRANQPDFQLSLDLTAAKPVTLQGKNGYSQKAAGTGHASDYYSITRMNGQGIVRVRDQTFQVTGLAWFDREWATNQLGVDQVGWNWFALQLDSGRELMVYQMRLKDGGIDPYSCGKWVQPDGQTVDVTRDQIDLRSTKTWKSPLNGATYPIGWKLSIPTLKLALDIRTPVDDQELRFTVPYWEGCVRVAGTLDQQPATGVGYMELTGYSGPLNGLKAGNNVAR